MIYKKTLSIIVPVYFNQSELLENFSRIKEALSKVSQNYFTEYIYIDDGSKDNSISELFQIQKKNNNVKIIKFTRNFGQIPAIEAGYYYANGDIIVNISADLQDPPELIPQMLTYIETGESEVVICTRNGRDESSFRRMTSKIFYKLIQLLNFSQMPISGFDYVMITNKVKDSILLLEESNAFWQGQILWTGFKYKFIKYKREKRNKGKSRWTFSKKVKYLLDGVLNYSYLPVRIMSVFGIFVSIIGFIYAIYIIFAKFFGNIPFTGWAPIMILILVLGGIQMLMIGIIGEYVWRTLDQVRKRPRYIIEKIYD